MRTLTLVLVGIFLAAHGHKHETKEASHFTWQEGDKGQGIVSCNGMITIVFSVQSGGYTPSQRAKIVATRLNALFKSHEVGVKDFIVKRENGELTVFYYHVHGKKSKGHIIATVDAPTAQSIGAEPDQVVYWWRDILRDELLITHGETPKYAAKYCPTLVTFSQKVRVESNGKPPTPQTTIRAMAGLSSEERATLRNLYAYIPKDYNPVKDSEKSTKSRTTKQTHHHN